VIYQIRGYQVEFKVWQAEAKSDLPLARGILINTNKICLDETWQQVLPRNPTAAVDKTTHIATGHQMHRFLFESDRPGRKE
jgi:hypothetical protein